MIRTKDLRNSPPEPADGLRVLVSRYYPRGIPKSRRLWDLWCPELGPSRELHAAVKPQRGGAPGGRLGGAEGGPRPVSLRGIAVGNSSSRMGNTSLPGSLREVSRASGSVWKNWTLRGSPFSL